MRALHLAAGCALLFGACLLPEYRVVEDGGASGGAGGASGRGGSSAGTAGRGGAGGAATGTAGSMGGGTAGSAGGAGGVNATGGTGGAVTGVGGTTAGTVAAVPAGGGRDRQRRYRGHRRPRRHDGYGRAGRRHRRAAAARSAPGARAAARPGAAGPPARAALPEQEAAGPARLDGGAELVAVDRGRLSVRWAAGADRFEAHGNEALHLEEDTNDSLLPTSDMTNAIEGNSGRLPGPLSAPAYFRSRSGAALPGVFQTEPGTSFTDGRLVPHRSIAEQQPAVPGERRRPGHVPGRLRFLPGPDGGQLRRARRVGLLPRRHVGRELQLQGAADADSNIGPDSAAGNRWAHLVCRFDAATNQLSIFVAGTAAARGTTRPIRSRRARVRSWSAAT